ncbi:MAG TPA: septal ring lytic transglycosylase RlpA family protein [Phycisphaerales bacterium]|nr:septal ring lytic transglycosylase RlpA family protein [Phycisphaerales bacterium]
MSVGPARWLGLGLLVAALAGCGGGGSVRVDSDGPGGQINAEAIPDAVPRSEPRSKYGNPTSYEVFGRRYYVMDSAAGYSERGIASWYGSKFHGRRTSSGEPYDMYQMTAAHKSLPLPTYVRVTNLRNGRSVIVKVNDRGPFHDNRIIDLSYAAATKLDILKEGTGLVEVTAIDPRRPEPARPQLVSAPAAGAPSGADMYIQVGAFASRQNAELFQSRLNSHSLGQVTIQEGRGTGGVVYRVRIGPLAGVDAADRTVQGLERLGLDDFRIVVD